MTTPPPRRILGYQPVKAPLRPQPKAPLPTVHQPANLSEAVLIASTQGSLSNTAQKDETLSKINDRSKFPICPSEEAFEVKQQANKQHTRDAESSTIQADRPQALLTADGAKASPKREFLPLMFDKQMNQCEDEEHQSEEEGDDDQGDSESGSAESSDQEIIGIDFDSPNNVATDGAFNKILSVREDMGVDAERLLKKLLKRYLEKNKVKVSSIENLRIKIGTDSPTIQLLYKINNEQRESDVLEVYHRIRESDPSTKTILRRLFEEQFEVLQPDVCKKLFAVVSYRSKYLQKEFKIEMGDRGTLINVLAAVHFVPENGSIQFQFIDTHYNSLSFNSLFLEKYKERLADSYKFYVKALKPRCTKKKTAYVWKEEDQAARPHIGDEEISSDDEPRQKAFKPISFDQVKERLTKLLSESLADYFGAIAKKEAEFEMLQLNDKHQDVDKQAILSEQIEEMQEALDVYESSRNTSRASFNQIITTRAPEKDKANELELIHKQLRMLRVQLDSKLPILSKKRELFRLLDKSNLVVLEGETGSGKSTQLPQMLCEYYKVFSNDEVKPIVLTQPRKIATRTLAERIAYQMGEEVHRLVDYVASSGSRVNPESKIVVKLDRLLLDEFENDPLLSNYSCLVIDEAHQRTISIDVIIGLIANVLKQRKDFKVIVTSATLDATLFEKYFRAKTFKVSGRLYPVDIIYKPYPLEQQFEDKIFRCITEEILEDRSTIRNKYKGHILTFCTGVEQINRLCDRMKRHLNMAHFLVIGLHGKLTAEEQRLAFSETPHKCKFIFSTRIAQTAITIDKVKVVIDPGHDRENVYDQKKKISSFQLKAISRSAAKQRAGRAGRTSPGYCFRMYDESFEKEKMPANKTPEIESVPLDIIVLRLKALRIKDLLNFPYLSKPKEENIKASVESMQLIGCLDYRQEITAIGRSIVRIPIEPLLSRAIIDALLIEKLDHSRRIVSRVIKILAIVANSQSVFYSAEDTREICEQNKFNEFAEQSGDFFSLLNVYTAFDRALSLGRDAVFCFTREKFLNRKSLFQSRDLVREINSIIEMIHVNVKDFGSYADELRDRLQKYSSDEDLILSCLVTSFCQNLCLFSGDAQIGYTLVAAKQPVQIYGSSFLALQGLTPRWILCYDIIKTSNTYCRIAQEVDFDMLKCCVSREMFRKYGLANCENFNPFYVSMEKPVPTVVLKALQEKKSENDASTPWLLDNNIVFDRDRNKVRLFVLQENAHLLREFEDYLKKTNTYLLEKDFVHNYLGSITAVVGPGCKIKELHLSNNFFSVKLCNISREHQDLLYVEYCMFWHELEIVKQNEILITFKSQEDRKTFMGWWEKVFLVDHPELKRCRLQLAKNYFERRNRVATGCMRLRFWSAESKQSNTKCIIYCDSHEDSVEKNAVSIATTAKELGGFIGATFKVTKKGNAINAYLSGEEITDEYELSRQLKALQAEHPVLLPHRHIIGFRDVDTKHSIVSYDEWIERIQRLFEGQVPAEHIRVYGSCQAQSCRKALIAQSKKQQTKLKHCEEHLTDLNCFVNIFNSKVADEFIEKYDGKEDVLGTEKLHATIEYRQSIMRVPSQIFSIFQARYAHVKDELMLKLPGLELAERNWVNYKGEPFVFIECSSQRRDKLMTPIATIKKVFTRHSISLSPDEVRAINRYEYFDRGYSKRVYARIIESLTVDFSFEIYLDYATMKSEIRLFCFEELFQKVEMALRKQLALCDEYSVRVSYRGKNIYKVQEVIQEFRNDVEVTISYSERCVMARGKPDVVSEFKNKIEALVNNATPECLICFNILSMPVRLLICGHTFCSACLCAHVRSVKDDASSYPLICPQGQGCKEPISVHDLRHLLDAEEFSQCCDRSIQRLVDNVRYHACFTVNCEQIFEVERTHSDGDSFHCPMCNIAYCKLCRDDRHEGMSCTAYQRKKKGELSKDEAAKMGIKTCGKCGNGIQKNKGCNHISCRCGAHICWNCLKIFETSDECYDHLAKKCGGIFPGNDPL